MCNFLTIGPLLNLSFSWMQIVGIAVGIGVEEMKKPMPTRTEKPNRHNTVSASRREIVGNLSLIRP